MEELMQPTQGTLFCKEGETVVWVLSSDNLGHKGSVLVQFIGLHMRFSWLCIYIDSGLEDYRWHVRLSVVA